MSSALQDVYGAARGASEAKLDGAGVGRCAGDGAMGGAEYLVSRPACGGVPDGGEGGVVADEECVASTLLCPGQGPRGESEGPGREADLDPAGRNFGDLAQKAEGVEGRAEGGVPRAVRGGGGQRALVFSRRGHDGRRVAVQGRGAVVERARRRKRAALALAVLVLRPRARAAAARQRLAPGHQRYRVTRTERAAASNSVDRSARLFSEPDVRIQSSSARRSMAKRG